MSQRIKSSLLLVFIASLFIGGLLLSFSPFIRDWFIGQNTLRHFEEFVEMPIERPLLEINDWNAIAEIERPSMGTVLQSVFSEPDGIVVGTITIPALNLELAIMDGLTNSHLLSGAATLYPNQPMGNGNYVLFGHHLQNESLLFGPILLLEADMDIYVSDKWYIYQYRVDETAIVSERDTHHTSNTLEPLLTLFTCDISGPTDQRFMAKASLIQMSPIE